MNPPTQGRGPDDLEVLNQAFRAFNEATEKLQSSYDSLKERVKQLDLELARKNQELFENLREKKEVQNYLSNILESLSSGVLVVNTGGVITTCNRTAGEITGKAPADCPPFHGAALPRQRPGRPPAGGGNP
ncbi:MAG: PAS domain-containing protein [Nitrospinaceae bacterium]|nr:MAG: PAS domain-containing protein [Nitrospinaceae bacterium]